MGGGGGGVWGGGGGGGGGGGMGGGCVGSDVLHNWHGPLCSRARMRVHACNLTRKHRRLVAPSPHRALPPPPGAVGRGGAAPAAVRLERVPPAVCAGACAGAQGAGGDELPCVRRQRGRQCADPAAAVGPPGGVCAVGWGGRGEWGEWGDAVASLRSQLTVAFAPPSAALPAPPTPCPTHTSPRPAPPPAHHS